MIMISFRKSHLLPLSLDGNMQAVEQQNQKPILEITTPSHHDHTDDAREEKNTNQKKAKNHPSGIFQKPWCDTANYYLVEYLVSSIHDISRNEGVVAV
jgi:hypothetical protein